jgi:uncharacterized protein
VVDSLGELWRPNSSTAVCHARLLLGAALSSLARVGYGSLSGTQRVAKRDLRPCRLNPGPCHKQSTQPGVPLSTPTGRLEVLSDAECLELFTRTKVGRVVISMGALPAALPVNYRLIDGKIFFFTGQGMKLHAALQNSVVGFEVDSIDEDAETGWSVLAVGHASEVKDAVTVAAIQGAGLRPWAAGDRSRLISVVPQVISGRRLSQPEEG